MFRTSGTMLSTAPPTGDKAVISLLPLALGIVADAVLVPLAPMLVLLQLGGGLGILLFQFLA